VRVPEPRRALRAEERFAELRREKARRRTERLRRELAGPAWHRMVRVVPVAFRLEGALEARVARVERTVLVDALREGAVFALDTAMRLLSGGYGFRRAVQGLRVVVATFRWGSLRG
jgi:hypothetical protein